MQPLKEIQSKTVVLPAADIDTDQIYPARYLTTTTKEGLGKLLFSDWRYLADGSPNPDFALNSSEAQGASILVAGPNFGVGSSREHAAWSLLDYGFRVVISTSFADIFRANCLKNGLLPVAVASEVGSWLLEHPGAYLSIDLQRTQITLPEGRKIAFKIDEFSRYCLLNGLDELGFLRSHLADIQRFEANRGD
jgi:3-isopropylmalate/(R)-2-methylmalate dehydratase small subunit